MGRQADGKGQVERREKAIAQRGRVPHRSHRIEAAAPPHKQRGLIAAVVRHGQYQALGLVRGIAQLHKGPADGHMGGIAVGNRVGVRVGAKPATDGGQ